MKKISTAFVILSWAIPAIFVTIYWIVPILKPAPVTTPEPVGMTVTQRQDFRDEVRAYLLESPEVLMEAIKVLESRQQEQQAAGDLSLVQLNAAEIFDDGISWVGGNPDGDITLVEFLDYRCAFCRRAHDQVAELIASDGNIRMIVKEFPILGEQSVISSRLAIATLTVAGGDDYRRLNNALMKFNAELTDNTMRHLLGSLDLDADAILAVIDSPEVTAHIAKVRSLATRMQISGTPTFVVQNELVRGYVPLEDMRSMIALQRQADN